jgi:hypothetical protein
MADYAKLVHLSHTRQLHSKFRLLLACTTNKTEDVIYFISWPTVHIFSHVFILLLTDMSITTTVTSMIPILKILDFLSALTNNTAWCVQCLSPMLQLKPHPYCIIMVKKNMRSNFYTHVSRKFCLWIKRIL